MYKIFGRFLFRRSKWSAAISQFNVVLDSKEEREAHCSHLSKAVLHMNVYVIHLFRLITICILTGEASFDIVPF
jgi:hypothetical protein